MNECWVKSIYKELGMYKKWTKVSVFLATGLVGVQCKRNLNLKDLKK